MAAITELREPFKSFFAKLDGVHVTVCPYNAAHLKIGHSWLGQLPELDVEDAKSLAAELDAAIAPVISRFRARKLAEVMALMCPDVDPTRTMRLR